MGLDGMGYHLREFALWILPSSWLSRVDPGSERMPFTWIGRARFGLGSGEPVTPSGANFGALFDPPDPSFFYWNLAQQNRALVV